VDAILRLANQYGIVVFLDPIETGGWLSVLQSKGPAKAFAYGQYLGKRYGEFRNIVWMSGNDFQEWSDPSLDALVLAVAKESGAPTLITFRRSNSTPLSAVPRTTRGGDL
jgi:hypothetical protein